MQNNVYELVSDINQRHELLDERLISLEDRMALLFEQLEVLPESLTKLLQQISLQQIIKKPALLEDLTKTDDPNSNQANANQSEQTHKHTHLHPNDAAAIKARPSWSSTNLTSPASSPGQQFLSPIVCRTSSFDT